MADAKIDYPKNVNVTGLMSFPLYSTENIEQLEAWRTRRNIGKPRFPDRIGFTLLLNQQQHDRVVANLKDVYLPFAADLKKVSGGSKGIDPKLVDKLAKLVADEDWSESNLPIRSLNDKDEENIEKNNLGSFVSKLKVAGPPNEAPIKIKALYHEEDETELEVVDLSQVSHLLGENTDPTALWWGASWPFKTDVRFNAFNAASFGVTGYVRTAYLLANRELPTFGAGDSAILEDGDDWSDE